MGRTFQRADEAQTPGLGRLFTLGPLAGIAMQGVLWTTVVGGALASAAYTWPTDPFSIVGAGDGAGATAFNLGLIATGVFAAPVAAWLWQGRRRTLAVLYGLVGVAFVLGGLFPIPSPLHEAAAGIFVFVWLLCWVAAVQDWRRGRRRIAVLQLLLGILAVAVWLPYDLGFESAMIGYGAAEALSFAVLSVWTVLSLFRDDCGPDAANPESAENRRIDRS